MVVKRDPEWSPRIDTNCHVTLRLIVSEDVLVCCRPGRDGSRHVDRDYGLRPIDEQLRSPSSPVLHEPLQCTSLMTAKGIRGAVAEAIQNGNGRKVGFGSQPCLDLDNVGIKNRRSARQRLATDVGASMDGAPLAGFPVPAEPASKVCNGLCFC